jgi:hypothetical protein
METQSKKQPYHSTLTPTRKLEAILQYGKLQWLDKKYIAIYYPEIICPMEEEVYRYSIRNANTKASFLEITQTCKPGKLHKLITLVWDILVSDGVINTDNFIYPRTPK